MAPTAESSHPQLGEAPASTVFFFFSKRENTQDKAGNSMSLVFNPYSNFLIQTGDTDSGQNNWALGTPG